MRVILDGKKDRAVGFNLHDYGAVEYGYAATVHKTQWATVDRVFVLATPGMDRHLAYVGMTRLRRSSPARGRRTPHSTMPSAASSMPPMHKGGSRSGFWCRSSGRRR